MERLADRLIRRLAGAEFVTITGGVDVIRSKIIALLNRNFDEEAEIEQVARAEAEKLVKQGIPGMKRDEFDLRKVEQLMKQKIAKDRGFSL
jgi:hypothetical protein